MNSNKITMKAYNVNIMKQWQSFLVVAVLVIFASFYAGGVSPASFVWKVFGNANVALWLNRDDAPLAMEIGKYYFNDGAYDLGKAKKAFEKAKQIDPELLGSRYQLSRIDFIQSRFQSALVLVNEELALHPEFDRSYYLRGLIYGYSGKLSLAAEDFQKFLETHEKSWAAHNDLAWIYFRQGEFEKVALTAKKGLEWNPDNVWLLTTYGTALLNLNKKDEAKRILTQALEKAEALTLEEWGKAYPGNNPEEYERGLRVMRNTIRSNLELVNK